jgi:hypothetical protein
MIVAPDNVEADLQVGLNLFNSALAMRMFA